MQGEQAECMVCSSVLMFQIYEYTYMTSYVYIKREGLVGSEWWVTYPRNVPFTSHLLIWWRIKQPGWNTRQNKPTVGVPPSEATNQHTRCVFALFFHSTAEMFLTARRLTAESILIPITYYVVFYFLSASFFASLVPLDHQTHTVQLELGGLPLIFS